MNRPNKEDDKYWGEVKILDGKKEIPFLHTTYEEDLLKYISFLETVIKEAKTTLNAFEYYKDGRKQ